MVGRRVEEGIEERAPGVYRIWVSAGRNPVTGKRQRVTKTVHGTLEDARRERQRLREQAVVHMLPLAPARMTVADWMEQWLEQSIVLGRWRPNTVRAYTSLNNKLIRPRIGRLKLKDLEPHHVQAWIVGLIREGYSSRTVTMARSILKKAMKDAEIQRLVPRNPVLGTERPKGQEPTDRKVLTTEEAAKLLRALQGSRYYSLIYVALHTGMRIGELLALKWDDWDEAEGALHVRRTIVYNKALRGYMLQETTKSKAGMRIVYLDKGTNAVLRRHRAEQAKLRLKLGARWHGHDLNLIFPGQYGKIQWPEHVRWALKAACQKAGILRVHPHMLRHTHISWLLASGWPIKEVASRVGQKSIAVTNEYTHPIPGLQKLLARQIPTVGPSGGGTKLAPTEDVQAENP